MIRALHLLLVIFCCTVASGCQKETAAPDKPTAPLIEGRWELVQTTGGIAGHTRPADPTRRKELLFGANGQVQFVLNGTTTITTTYTLSQAITHTSQQSETFVVYGLATPMPRQYIATLTSTTLVLNDDHSDGISATYQRIPPSFCGTL